MQYTLTSDFYGKLDLEGLKKLSRKVFVFYRGDAKAAAISFYSPIYLHLSMYSDQPERKEEAFLILDRQIEEFFRLYRKKN